MLELMPEAEELATLLADRQLRVVFAESCTAGLAPALLAAVPGISSHLCGSFVTYREECKQAWLGVPAALLDRHTAVSPEVTEAMARLALERSESADYSAAITGHLGPNAPASVDGVCFLAAARRDPIAGTVITGRKLVLSEPSRLDRQLTAARMLLAYLAEKIAE
jgi:PncC family amidohydrolase